ncbi:MAG: hypothetical protein EA365_00785 [Gloeocapsa sp. DLM2.Bin57]|nr:MAG: hypothetical protein EA365_00785 [Gloeocapsa sp. DLM2.Bin57]
MKRWLLSLSIVLMLTGCSGPTPSLGFAPDGTIINKAIALALEQTQASLSEQLTTNLPTTEISNINVDELEPLYVGKLPTYHLRGTYVLKLQLSENNTEKQTNEFDIYVQRQIEGKTWRLLKKQPDREEWFSYSLEKY